MAVNLIKGQNINLSKTFGAAQVKYGIGLSWDVGEATYDLDAMALLLDKKSEDGGKVINDDFVCAYFNNDRSRANFDKITFGLPGGGIGFQSIDGSVKSYGDNRTGEGDNDDEKLELDLSKVDPRVKSILVLVNIYTDDLEASTPNFGQVKNAAVRLYKGDSDIPELVFELSEDFSTERNLEFVEIYNHNGEWKFKALKKGTNLSFPEELRKFGISC